MLRENVSESGSAAGDPTPTTATSILRPPRKGFTPGRLVVAAFLVVAVQFLMIAAAGSVLPTRAPPQIGLTWGGSLEGCPVNSTGFGYLNYSITLWNVAGPNGYAVLGLGVNHLLVRYWAVYVPQGAWDEVQNISYALRCGTYQSAGIVLVTTVPS